MVKPVKYSSKRGGASAVWTLPDMQGLRIFKTPQGWKVAFAFYVKPWREKMEFNRMIGEQRFRTRNEALSAAEAARACLGL